MTGTRSAREPAVRARLAVAAVFTVHGAVTGSFAARIPWIQDRLHLSPGALGIALLMPAVGAVLAMPFAGRAVHRLGGRTATRLLLAAWCGSLALPALAPGLPWLCLALLVYGLTSGMSDVAMNAQGVAVEQRLGRSVMSGLHGMWSVGGLVGSGIGALAAHAGVDARLHLGIAAVVLVATGQVACRSLLQTRPDPAAEEPPRFALPTGAVLAIGLVAFCAIFAEGASADWCAVYLRRVAGADAGVAAASYTTFALTMAVGRLGGDTVVRRLGSVATVRLSGTVGTVGAVLVVVARSPALAIVAFALLGLGIAIVVPLAFAAAGHAGAHPGHAIAGVATVAYGAGLAAPGAIGGIADATSLSVSFVVVAVLVAVVAFGAGTLRAGSSGPRAGART